MRGGRARPRGGAAGPASPEADTHPPGARPLFPLRHGVQRGADMH